MDAKNYLFLSHKTIDKPAIEKMAHRLRAAGLKVWLDMWKLLPGEAWQPVLEGALPDSASCLSVEMASVTPTVKG